VAFLIETSKILVWKEKRITTSNRGEEATIIDRITIGKGLQ